MNRLYEILEICLQELENGAEIEGVLLRYPDLADELRPILQASLKAKELSVPSPSAEVLKRNKARILQRAAEMRESKAARDARRGWSVPLRRFSAVFTVLILLFASGTGLVSASSNTVPGDSLYSVKRSWENFTLFFTFDMVRREELELEFEHERLEELHELFTEGRSADVDFSGYVTRQSADEWRISGITVLITAQTSLPQRAVAVGDAVRVTGQIWSEDIVAADRIELLPDGAIVPEVEDNEFENEESNNENEQLETESGEGSETDAPETDDVSKQEGSIKGDVSSVQDNFIVVNGVVMDIRFAEVEGVPGLGASVEAEGYFDVNGIFIVDKIKFETDGDGPDSSDGDKENGSNESGDESNDNDNSSNDDNSDDDSDDSNSNDDDDDNSNNDNT